MIIINWGEDVLQNVGVYRQYTAASLVRQADKGVGLPPTSAVIMAEGTPSVVLGTSASSVAFRTSVTYYYPEGEGEIYTPAPADQPKIIDKADLSWDDPKTTTTDKIVSADSVSRPNPKATTTDSVRLPTTKKIVLPF